MRTIDKKTLINDENDFFRKDPFVEYVLLIWFMIFLRVTRSLLC